ncbi:MAG: twitching motility protein PilI [Candidatus Endobugula sp.]|jgi:twitching motility protein PilI
MTETVSAFSVLQSLAAKSLGAAQQLPAQLGVVEQWRGIGFSLLGLDFVVPMEELVEMLEVPDYTRLPSVQSWVKGVANVRGRLLPLFDLAAYFAGSLSGNRKTQRLLVIDKQHLYAGLWVDAVHGMQYFPVNQRSSTLPTDFPEALTKFTEGCFNIEGRQWTVFHPLQLCQESTFIDVAAS